MQLSGHKKSLERLQECRMKSRYLYLAAAIAFLVVAVFEFAHAQNTVASVVDAITGAIFLFLGISPPRQPRRKG
jgi:uncharacterized membrane protein YeiH